MNDGAAPKRTPSVSIVVISKDEPALADTLDHLARQAAEVVPDLARAVELLVVDASSGRLAAIQAARPDVAWIDYEKPEGVRVSIPHQRNLGVRSARGQLVVFTDSGCVPQPGWLAALLAPLVSGEERVVTGLAGATGSLDPYAQGRAGQDGARYVSECATINLAFDKAVFEGVGGFDESFAYGSDVDFSWRVIAAGVRIRYLPEAVVLHDWGSRRRQLKRSFNYGKARARLLAKHVLRPTAGQRRPLGSEDLVPVLYPLYLLGLPLALRYRSYLLLLVVPLWRNRHHRPVQGLVDHFVLAAGVLAGARDLAREARA